MKLPTNLTIELFQGDPAKGRDGWLATASWTNEQGEQTVIRYMTPFGFSQAIQNVGRSLSNHFLERMMVEEAIVRNARE